MISLTQAAISVHEIEGLKSTDYPFMIAYEALDAPPLDWQRLNGEPPVYFDVDALTVRLSR